MTNKWLNWTPSDDEVTEQSAKPELTKPTKPSSVSFVSAKPGLSPIIEAPRPDATEIISEPADACSPPSPTIPRGVKLIRWEPKTAPVMIDVTSIVTDVNKFIEVELRDLDSRLNNPWTIRGGWSVPQIIDRLRQAGLEVEIDVKAGRP